MAGAERGNRYDSCLRHGDACARPHRKMTAFEIDVAVPDRRIRDGTRGQRIERKHELAGGERVLRELHNFNLRIGTVEGSFQRNQHAGSIERYESSLKANRCHVVDFQPIRGGYTNQFRRFHGPVVAGLRCIADHRIRRKAGKRR